MALDEKFGITKVNLTHYVVEKLAAKETTAKSELAPIRVIESCLNAYRFPVFPVDVILQNAPPESSIVICGDAYFEESVLKPIHLTLPRLKLLLEAIIMM